MPRFTLRPKAEEDLERIWRYTADTWGERQADTYVRQLNDGFQLLAGEPGIGQNCDYIREGYRKHHVRRHLIFYRQIAEAAIEIIRVLHERMDVEQHLIE